MQKQYTLHKPGLLLLAGSGGEQYYGGNQEWYAEHWKQQAGCGPTAASALFWYLAATRPGAEKLAPATGGRDEFIALMEAVWEFVTPGFMGLSSTRRFCAGAAAYGEAQGAALRCERLRIRPGTPRGLVYAFLRAQLGADRPVAFLNYTNGALQEPESWHWVVLVAFTPATGQATVLDGGRKYTMPLDTWLETTRMGGGMVAVETAEP